LSGQILALLPIQRAQTAFLKDKNSRVFKMIKHNGLQGIRLKQVLLFNCLTFFLYFAAIAGLNGCKPFGNDARHDIQPGTEKAYDTSLEAGKIANEILSSKHFTALEVEIQSVRGFAPSQESLDQLRAFLLKHVKKSRGIRIIVDSAIPAPTRLTGEDGYSLNDLKQIEARHRRHYTAKGTLVLYALFLDKNLAGDIATDRILGRAYGAQSVAIFMNSLKSISPAPANPAFVETTTILHEFGHLLGLVSMDDTARSHADLAHHSCTNSKCLMNHAAESGAQIGAFTAEQIPTLDDDCENDLKTLAI
jgi:hypothetical protein